MKPATFVEKRPLSEILKITKSPLRGVSGLEFYNAYVALLGKQPERSHAQTCIYSHEDLRLVLGESIEKSWRLRELESWKHDLPLAFTLKRSDAIKRLVAIGNPGWLARCSYTHGRLMLGKADAEQLCYLRKTGHGAMPLRWLV